jgi:type I restriction enzyme S subunit
VNLPTYPLCSSEIRAPWLGELPEHWEVKRLKFIFPRLFSGVSVNSDNSPSLDGSVAILKTSCVYGNRFNAEENKRVVETELDRVACPVTRDSLVISRMNTPELVGSCGYVDRDYEHLFLPDRLWIARFPNHIHAAGKFAWYLVISHALASLTGVLATGTSDSMKNLTQEAFLDICVGVPPRSEQQQIAAFLDWKTGQIDALIARKKELLEKLKEKRLAVITQAVTRGLNLTAPLRDSGVPWLGDVPAHWEVKRLKFQTGTGNGAGIQIGPFGGMLTELTYAETGEFKLYGQENVLSGDFDKGTRWLTAEQYADLRQYAAEAGDFLFTRKGSIGGCAIFPENAQPGIIDSDTIRLRVNPKTLSTRFLLHAFRESEYLQFQVQLIKRGAILSGLNTTTIADLMLVAPPLDEQIAISDYLDRQASRINELAAKVESAVARLTEYRTALITAATTGKIDVRKVKIPAVG